MKRILVCSEFSQIGSGYAAYTNELLKGFLSRGLEFAELASFCSPDDPRINSCPWKVYPVQPHRNNEIANQEYNSHPANAFGRHIFESVLLDYRPTHVINPRDIWNGVHEIISPLRDFYSHIIMPAVDSDPQHKTWLEMYSQADKIVTYCDWSTNLLRNYGLKNVVGAASPVPPSEYRPLENKVQIKETLGLGNIQIIGTVMRNQPRKLFPKLFKAFRRFLNESGRDDIYLYCHTSYPDIWELDELLLEYNVGHKVLFTYGCMACGFVESSFYKGAFGHCVKCRKPEKTLRLPTTHMPISRYTLNEIYNLFDLYIQFSALEGFGIPVAEAVACGAPAICVNYSGMETFINEANAIPIEVAEFHIESETGRRFAIPDETDAVNKLSTFFSQSKDAREHHSKLARMLYGVRDFGACIDVWMKAINESQPKLDWNAPQREYRIPTDYPRGLPSTLFARWLICNVLQDLKYVGSYLEARLVRDLDNGFALLGHDNKYYFEAVGIASQKFQTFNQQIAYEHFHNLLVEKARWENRRVEHV